MRKNYFLHRISHEWEVSYPLLDLGYLSIGWSQYCKSDLLSRIKTDGENGFNEFMGEKNNTDRNRWNLWYFSQFKEGDYVVVPLFEKKFGIYEVIDSPQSVLEIGNMDITLYDGGKATLGNEGITDSLGRIYDIGFVVKVKSINVIPRTYADADLVSRMKIRQTNARIDDLSKSVEEAALAKEPINIHEKIHQSVSESMKETIRKYIKPDDLEYAVKWYFEKKGADSVWIPSKNEPGKENGADADVIAEFYDLGVVFYVQAKNYKGETGDWAVKQISEYNPPKQEEFDGNTYIPWVVSMSEKYSKEAIDLAKQTKVRLINGDEFIKMILDLGLDGIENATKQN